MAKVYQRVNAKNQKMWCVDWFDSQGKRHRRDVSRFKGEAEAWASRVEGERQKQRLIAEVYGDEVKTVEPLPFDKFAALYFSRVSMLKRSKSSEANRLTGLIRHFGGAFPKGRANKWPLEMTGEEAESFEGKGPLLSSIKTADIERFRAKMVSANKRPATINRYRSLLHHMFGRAIKWGYARQNPVSDVPREKEDNQKTRFLTADEEERLFNGTNANGHPFLPEPARSIALFAMHTGMRWGEITTLSRDSVDLEQRLVTIQATNSKSKRVRSIPLNDIALDVITKAMARGVGRKRVFTYRDGGEIRSIRTVFEKALVPAKIADFTFHDLRHTFASRLAQRGVPMPAIKELMGHSSIEVTMRYSHLVPGNLRDAVDVLTGFGRKYGNRMAMDKKLPAAKSSHPNAV